VNVEAGDRFITRDKRDEGRVIEIKEVLPVNSEAEKWNPLYRAEVEVHPNNPSAVGRKTTVSLAHLVDKFRKISR
jgi:hypothetical protein